LEIKNDVTSVVKTAFTAIASASNRAWTLTEPDSISSMNLLTSMTIKTSSLRFTRACY